MQLAIQAVWGDAVMRRYETRRIQPVMMAGEGESEVTCFSRISRPDSTTLASAIDPFRREKSIPIAASPHSTAS